MPRTRIKICGIRNLDTARLAIDAGADAIGLVFVAGSPRAVTVAQARVIVEKLPAFVEPVGVFVDLPVEDVAATAAAVGLTTVQLHGCETPALAAELSVFRVIRALGFRADHVLAELDPWRGAAPNLVGILCDAAPPPASSAGAAHLQGGQGRSFDWAALAALQREGSWHGLPPVILAGGLTPENVGAAIAAVRPHAVDVSSGVEAARGMKDPAKIRAFCAAVRAADARCI